MTDATPPANVDTLGVLLVHGIGSQRRGDTLLQAGTAIHEWLRRWVAAGNLGLGGRFHGVDVVDTSLAGGGEPGAPASTRIIFREVDVPVSESPRAWLVAESCWADTFRPPSYGEFVRWVTFVVPFAVILHLLPPFRRAWARSDASPKAWRPLLRVFAFGLRLVPIALSGVVLQSLLLAMIVVALLPLGFVRSFAGWVQKTLALTIGDSYVFVTSPITESAIVSQVQRDLDWLAARCDRVVVVAHSQGAAVAYRAIERRSWTPQPPAKLTRLITYGAGVRKLFDLETAARSPAQWTFFGMLASALCAGFAGFAVLGLAGHVPALVAVPGMAVTLFALTGVLVGAAMLDKVDPTLLPIRWDNFYASHDLVPYGPLETTAARDPDPLAGAAREAARVAAFQQRQREVVNARSFYADHTTYWSSPDDFVARVVTRLATEAQTPVAMTLEDDWIDLAAARRRWRVSMVGGFRLVTGLAALSVLAYPTSLVASVVPPALMQSVSTLLADARVPPSWRSVVDSPWVLGAVALLVVVWAASLLAAVGWRTCERGDLRDFFHQQPYGQGRFGPVVFALGWLAVVLLPCVLTGLAAPALGQWLSVTWSPLMLSAITAMIVVRAGHAPGHRADCGRKALARGERLLEQAKLDATSPADRRALLRSASACFGLSELWLDAEPDSAELARARHGQEAALEALRRTPVV